MDQRLSIFAKNEDCLGYVLGTGELIVVFVIGSKTKDILHACQFTPVGNFVNALSVLFDHKFKAIILNIFEITPPGFSNNVKFCEKIREELTQLKIMHRFISDAHYYATTSLIVGNITCKLRESIMVVAILGGNYIIFGLCFTNAGYEIVSYRSFAVDEKESLESIKQKIYGSSTPRKVVVVSIDPSLPIFIRLKNNASKFENLVAFDLDVCNAPCQLVHEMYKWLIDKSYVKYHLIPASSRAYYSSDKSVEDKGRSKLVEINQSLPYKESYILSRLNKKAVITFRDSNSLKPYLLQQFNLTQKCHYYRLNISLDAEHFPTVELEPIIQREIKQLTSMCERVCKSKVPVVMFFYNLSFICLPTSDSKSFELMDEWNGLYGRDMFISFNEEKPKYFEDAVKVFETKPSFVVYDIIKILSLSPDYIDPDSDWKFTLTKDVNNPVLLEFDNFDGTRKAASPQLLLALLIKQHVKAIATKTGSKPKRMAYCMMGTEKDVADDKIHLGIKEAFNMLKIDTFLLKF